MREFRTFQYGDARGVVPVTPPGLYSRLDGKYWEKKQNDKLANSKKNRGLRNFCSSEMNQTGSLL